MGRFRLTGVSAPFGGVQWENHDGDAEIARRVVSILEDRRLLWRSHEFEVPAHSFASAGKVREELTAQINTLGIGPDLARRLKSIRRLFADFMTYAPQERAGVPYPYSEMRDAVERLRAGVGEHLAPIVANYNLDVDDRLASIIPPSDQWFFEELAGS